MDGSHDDLMPCDEFQPAGERVAPKAVRAAVKLDEAAWYAPTTDGSSQAMTGAWLSQ